MPRITFEEKDGGRRLFIIDHVNVLPGTNDMTQADWDHVRKHKNHTVKHYLSTKELREESAEVTKQPPPEPAADPNAHDADDIAEFVKQISAMSVEDASAALEAIDVKAAFIALRAKDNREAIQLLCEKRISELV